jgi:hypothetical protein
MLCPALGAPRTLQDSAEKGARSHSWVTNHVQGLDCDGILGAIVVALWQRWTHQAADVLLSNARRGWQRAGILGPHTSAQSRDPEAGTPISLEPGGYIGEGTRKSSSRYMAGMARWSLIQKVMERPNSSRSDRVESASATRQRIEVPEDEAQPPQKR